MGQKRENPLVFYIFYFVVFFGGAIYGSFISMYLSNAGMKSETIGLVNGIIQVISLIAYPVWGMLADRAKTKNTVLIIELMLIIATLVFFNFAKGVLMLAIAMIVFSIFNQPMHGVYETITIEHARRNGWNYSPIRMTGTFGFSLMRSVCRKRKTSNVPVRKRKKEKKARVSTSCSRTSAYAMS